MIVVNNKIPQTILDELKVNATRQEYQSTTQDEHIIAIDSNNYEATTQNEDIITVDRSNEEQNHEETRFEVEGEVEKETKTAFMIRQEFEKNLIKTLEQKTSNIEDYPTKEEIEGFWSNLWSKEGKYNNDARWIKDEENSNNNIPEMQLQEINKNDVRKYILQDKTLTDDKCRVCNQQQETIEHIIAGCSILASTDYIRRHDNVAKIVHQHPALHHNLIESKVPYYTYSPEILLENSIFMNKVHKRTYLIEIAVPLTNNLQRKHTEKIQKYIELAAEIKDMWEQREVIPHTLHRAIQQLQMPEMIYKKMQKAVILDTCALTRKFLQH
ncbi:hypothetical protein ILUMI_19620 [Ignelater luminosus]|uniref:Reverse transcriptase zinc-binding domain-containing protein n=1 Tax=Ignelater luminosus TaxID=2038154 RepID=A0A8K0CFU9_IGNLU|nr:hypothetical protein ILUMI_19620 [Ignelater luminosus]